MELDLYSRAKSQVAEAILRGLDFEPSCDGAWERCPLSNPPVWVKTNLCCNWHRLLCEDCRQVALRHMRDTYENGGWLKCRKCHHLFDTIEEYEVATMWRPLDIGGK